MLLRAIFLSFAAISLLAGCEKPCEVPAGKYELTYKPIEGDCPDELVAGFDGKKSDLDIEPGACRRFAFQHAVTLPNGCEVSTDMSAELAAAGVEDGQAAVTVHCKEPEVFTCRHLFSVEYRPKP